MTALPQFERVRRRQVIERFLGEGYRPPHKFLGETEVVSPRGSVIERASKSLGVDSHTLTDWIDVEMRHRLLGMPHQFPDWGKYKEPSFPEMISKGTSILSKEGREVARWDKTRLRGRDDTAVPHLPDPKVITKISTLYDQEGSVISQWIGEKPADIAKKAAWEEWAKALAEPLPRAPITIGPEHSDKDLMCVLPVGDHHLGMLAWHEEVDSNYDLEIGERLLVDAFHYLINASPNCDRAAVVFLGDSMHTDNHESVTPTNKNPLDSDGRFPKLIRIAVRMMRRVIEMTAAKHGHVRVIVEIGNHDPISSLFLTEALANIYEDDPRIDIDRSPKHFHYLVFGQNLIGTHHGNTVKAEDLPLLMATDQKEAWGQTKYRMWMTGHRHQRRVLEKGGCTVETFRVLPPTDAWAYTQGYRAGREMQSIILHKDFGEVARNICNPAMFSEEKA